MELKVLFLLTISLFLQGKISAQELVEMKLVDSISIPFEFGSSMIRNSSKWITCKGYSNTAKLVPESTEENKRKNMRVDVVFMK